MNESVPEREDYYQNGENGRIVFSEAEINERLQWYLVSEQDRLFAGSEWSDDDVLSWQNWTTLRQARRNRAQD